MVAKYFLGIRLPQELEEECEAWRRKFRAPRTVAHITLIPPFGWESEETDLLKLLKETVQGIKPFLVQGCGLGSFGRRVLFVNVELNEDFKTAQDQLAKASNGRVYPAKGGPIAPISPWRPGSRRSSLTVTKRKQLVFPRNTPLSATASACFASVQRAGGSKRRNWLCDGVHSIFLLVYTGRI